MSKEQTIAIIDSGIGGVSVLKRFLGYAFKGNFIYMADNMYMPYGNKDKKFLKQRIEFLIKILKEHYLVDQIYIACNTASSLFYGKNLKDVYLLSFNDADTYLVTNLSSKNLKGLKTIKCNNLAEKIEQNIFNKPKLKRIINDVVVNKELNKLTSLTLGCTHYELVYDIFKELCPSTIIKLNSQSMNYYEESNNQLNIIVITTKKDYEYEKKIRKLIFY